MENKTAWILGLDLGVSSIGWARLDEDGVPLQAGVRIFAAGNEGDIEQGKDESRNAHRQTQRSQRRNLWRRARRLVKFFRRIQTAGLLPPCNAGDPAERDKTLKALDAQIEAKHLPPADPSPEAIVERTRLAQLIPYTLRAKALTEKLEPFELGRALYHLGQRRGYLSNRKDSTKIEKDSDALSETKATLKAPKADKPEDKKDERRVVLGGIKNIEDAMKALGSPTLGAYFATLDPESARVRTRHTSRKMHLDEFEAIWNAQLAHHPELLTADNKKFIHRACFHQRPLKSARYRIVWKNKGKPNERKVYQSILGKCELESKPGDLRGPHRAPWADPVSQRFRMIQKVNDLEAIDKNGVIYKLNDLHDERSKKMREELLAALEIRGDMTFGAIRKLPHFKGIVRFNLQKTDEELPGDNLAANLQPIFEERWPLVDKQAVAQTLLSIDKEVTLERIARQKFGLSADKAREFSRIKLPRRYVNHSRKAMSKLLELMEQGVPYMTARLKLYPGSFQRVEPLDVLPPAKSAIPELRNPNVLRTLTEMRKVVNALIRQHAKPDIVRVELARDLKRGAKERAKIWQNNQQRQKERGGYEMALEKDPIWQGRQRPSGRDILKYQLWMECNRECPYTHKTISFNDLFGAAPKFDIEHIIPMSRCLDDSFLNKTLCCVDFNRNRKKNRAPAEVFEPGKEWDEVLQSVSRFAGDGQRVKLERFELQGEALSAYIEGFTQRQLNDTKYASKLSRRYLGLLFGLAPGQEHGADEETQSQRIQIGNGQITAMIRSEMGLHRILNDGPSTHGGDADKSRDDHRHHAIDAIVIGMTSPSLVQMLNRAAATAREYHRKRFAPIQPPYPGLEADVRRLIDGMIVSHRADRRVTGALHDETLYSPPRDVRGNRADEGEYFHVRKPLVNLSSNEAEKIVDPIVKALVLKALGGGEPKKVFKDEKNLPFMTTRDGGKIPIKRARIKIEKTVMKIASGPRQRHVISGSNHHIEVFEVKDSNGKITWVGKVVDMMTAYQRKKEGKPIISPGVLFSLASKEAFEVACTNGKKAILIYTTNDYDSRGEPRPRFSFHTDARMGKDLLDKKKAKYIKLFPVQGSGMDKIIKTFEQCREDLKLHKVSISILGEVHPAND